MEISNTELTTNLMTVMNQGGWVMWVLLVMSIVSVAVALERTWALRRGIDLGNFLDPLGDALLRKRSVKEALEACREIDGPVRRMTEAALRRFDRSPAQLEKALERHANGELRRLNRGLGILAAVATTAPLLGFLGTVTGMMHSFETLASLGMSNPGAVAQGIGEALATTAAGLVVAVPVQLAYQALSGRIGKFEGDMEAVGNFLLEAREEIGTAEIV